MKGLILYMSFLLLIPGTRLCGQQCDGGCLTNGTFWGACGDDVNIGSCDTWDATCGIGWNISNGTPQMYTNPSYVVGKHYMEYCQTNNPYSVQMWSQYQNTNGSAGIIGEGIYTSFPFVAGQSYDVRINFYVNVSYPVPSPGSNGTINVYAAKGLTSYTTLDCGSPLPNISASNKLPIISYNLTTATATQNIVTTITPATGTSFDQLWIYPLATAANGYTPYVNLIVTSIFVCPSCPSGTVYYNSGVLPTSVSVGTIYAGSSVSTGGSGTVTNSSSQTTSLVATNAIYLEPEFNASVTGTGSFSASIAPCASLYTSLSTPDIYDTINNDVALQADSIYGNAIRPGLRTGEAATDLNLNSPGATPAKFLVYPTVSTGMVNITGSPGDLANADILVSDESGQVVFRSYNAESTNISLDLGNLKNGFYFLQVRNNAKINTQKIIISR